MHDFVRKQKQDIINQRGDDPADHLEVDGKQLRADFKKDFLKYFEIKLTKGGADLNSQTEKPSFNTKPKLQKFNASSNVESISQNVQ